MYHCVSGKLCLREQLLSVFSGYKGFLLDPLLYIVAKYGSI